MENVAYVSVLPPLSEFAHIEFSFEKDQEERL
jgi:hypothetical protein